MSDFVARAMGDEPPAGIGHNNPPSPTPLERLLDEANARIDAANRWLTERPEIVDDEMADKAGGFKKQVSDVRKDLDGMRLAENRAFEAAQKEKYGSVLDLLRRAHDMIGAKLTAYLQEKQRKADELRRQQEAEARRKQQEAAEAQRRAEESQRQAGADALRAQQAAENARKAAEAATQAAAQPVRAAVKGDYTTRAVTLRTIWRARVTDAKAALKHYGKHPVVQKAALEAALQLANEEAKLRKDASMAPPGFEFYPEQKAA